MGIAFNACDLVDTESSVDIYPSCCSDHTHLQTDQLTPLPLEHICLMEAVCRRQSCGASVVIAVPLNELGYPVIEATAWDEAVIAS